MYKSLIKPNYEERIVDFRHYVSRKAIQLGESVMPEDVAGIMNKADNSGKYKYLLFNGFTNVYGKFLLMIDIYEGLGDSVLPDEMKECNIDNLQNYF